MLLCAANREASSDSEEELQPAGADPPADDAEATDSDVLICSWHVVLLSTAVIRLRAAVAVDVIDVANPQAPGGATDSGAQRQPAAGAVPPADGKEAPDSDVLICYCHSVAVLGSHSSVPRSFCCDPPGRGRDEQR